MARGLGPVAMAVLGAEGPEADSSWQGRSGTVWQYPAPMQQQPRFPRCCQPRPEEETGEGRSSDGRRQQRSGAGNGGSRRP